MTENVTETTEIVEAPADQTVRTTLALPTVGKALQNALDKLTPEAMSKAVAEHKSLRLYTDATKLYAGLTQAGDKIEGGKTLAGAYAWRAGVDAGESKGDIGNALGLQTVTRLGYVAKLHFELGFMPSDPEWSDLTSKLVTVGDFTKMLKRSDCQRADVLNYLAKWRAPKPTAEVGGSESEGSDAGAGGQDSGSRGAGANNGVTIPQFQNNSVRIDGLEKLLAQVKLSDLTPAEWLRLSDFHDAVGQVVTRDADAKIRSEGHKLAQARDRKAKADAAAAAEKAKSTQASAE